MFPIEIEEYDAGLYEISDLTSEHLIELQLHLSMSVERLSPAFQEFSKKLNRVISSLDVPRSA